MQMFDGAKVTRWSVGRLGRYRHLLISAAPLALALAAGPQALAQSVTGGGDLSHGPIGTPDWLVSGDLVIGVSASGSLTIADGGTVENDSGYLGGGGGGDGTVTVSGQRGRTGLDLDQ